LAASALRVCADTNVRKEVRVNSGPKTHRRSFLGGVFGAVAAASLPISSTRAAVAQDSGPDDWIKDVKGTHRCLFDFPQHKNGMPLLHILNYLNTYTAAYRTGAGQVGAVGTFYSVGSQSSIALAFNDAMWSKYGLGAYTGLKDAAGKPYTRNVFNQLTREDLHLVMQAIDSPTIPGLVPAMPALGIENLQKMAPSSCCARTRSASGVWSSKPGARATRRTSKRICGPTCCTASRSYRPW
jgi:hypothetical protein